MSRKKESNDHYGAKYTLQFLLLCSTPQLKGVKLLICLMDEKKVSIGKLYMYSRI